MADFAAAEESPEDAPEIIDCSKLEDSDDGSAVSEDLDWFGPRTSVDLRVGERSYASGVVVLQAADEAWFNARKDEHLADLEDALAELPALGRPPGDKPQRAAARGKLLDASVKLTAAPAPYLLLVGDEASPGGYRELTYCGMEAECCVRPKPADGGPPLECVPKTK
mmetsp:Transcript_2531/g.7418  ORF Transcript_2531/g.7418 Transcript_2531/m.7418 type:complete len:167 (+) Transcript_2531:178-678(+)